MSSDAKNILGTRLESRRTSFFIPVADVPHVHVRALRHVDSTVLLVTKPSEGADSVGGQLRGDEECPFSGITSAGRVRRKVPESDTRSVPSYLRACTASF